MARVKKFGVLSFAKFFALFGFIQGVFSVIGYFFFSKIMNSMLAQISRNLAFQVQSLAPPELGALPVEIPVLSLPSLNVASIFSIIVLSTFIWFLIGLTLALNYNSISKIVGGLEVEIE